MQRIKSGPAPSASTEDAYVFSHPLIIATRNKHKLKISHFRSYDEYYKELRESFGINVSDHHSRRAFILGDRILLAAEAASHTPHFRTSNQGGGVEILTSGEPIHIYIREKYQQIKHSHPASNPCFGCPTYDLQYTGDLEVVLEGAFGVGRRIADNAKRRLEDRIVDLVQALAFLAQAAAVRREEHDRRHREYEQAREEEQARAQREADKLKQNQELMRHVSNWRAAKDIRSYVAEVRDTESTRATSALGNETWLAEALSYADSIDPIVQGLQPR